MKTHNAQQPLKTLSERLNKFKKSLRMHTNSTHVLHFISSSQLLPSIKNSNHKLATASETPSKFDRKLYCYGVSQVRHYSRAFCYVEKVACYEHAETINRNISDGFGISTYALMRGLVERVAKAEYLRKKLQCLLDLEPGSEEFTRALEKTKDDTVNSLYGTTFDWGKATEHRFSSKLGNELRYNHDDADLIDKSNVENHIRQGIGMLEATA